MIHVEDKSLALPDGRTLAYADNGNTSSLSVVLFLHGAFGVGNASRLPHALLEKNVHFVAPSLPGWGRSSPVKAPSSYATTLAMDITALITHLHPQTAKLKLYISGHSFGTVAAQILHGLPPDVFPLGRQIVALVLLAPLSPPHCHKEYAKNMTWQSYLMAGPPAHYVPFNIITRLAKIMIAGQFRSEALAETFVLSYMNNIMDEEREVFARWRDDYGLEEGQFEREMGRSILRSIAHTWQGFLDVPAIYHSGWGGFCPERVTHDRPVLLVSFTGDYLAPEAMAQWLARRYTSGTLKSINGSYISAFFYLDEIWRDVFEIGSTAPLSTS